MGTNGFHYIDWASILGPRRPNEDSTLVLARGPLGSVIRCLQCDATEDVSEIERLVASHWYTPNEAGDAIAAILQRHEHAKPKPLTPAEREAVKVRGVHRRGALRCNP